MGAVMFLSRLIYYSKPQGLLSDELENISVISQANNYLDGITGVLFYNGDWFVQVLEGGRTRVTRRFLRILSDERHRDITLIDFSPIDERMFHGWELRYIGGSPDHEEIVRRFMPEGFDPTVIRDGAVLVKLLRALVDDGKPQIE
jgi:hypothetical protein